MIIRYERSDELYHHGIRGMHWNVRRFQNEDGSYTALGKLRYGIGQKGRETGKMMSDWSRQHTQGAKGRETGGGGTEYKNSHMISAARAQKYRVATTDNISRVMSMRSGSLGDSAAARENRINLARGIADVGLQRLSKAVSGREALTRADGNYAALGSWNKLDTNWTGKHAPTTTRGLALEQHHRAQKAIDYIKRYQDQPRNSAFGDKAKQIAGNYGRYAKEGLTGAAASALAAKNGLQYRAQEAAGNARKGAGAFGEIMKAYGKEIGGNANSALARAQFNARNAGDNVQNALRRGAATLGVSAGMNANVAGQRLWDAIRQRATGDPGEDMYKPDPTARSGYDRRVSNAIQASRAINTEAARQAENNRPAGHNVTGTFGGARSTTGKSVADYQKEMLERARSSTPIINNKTPYVLQFGNDRYVPQLTQEGLQLTRTRGKTSASNYDYDIRDKQAAAAARDRHAVGTSITIPGSEAARSTSSASATPSTSSRVERSEYMDRIKAIQDANKYRADLAAASSGRRAPAELMFDQAVRSVQNYGKGPTTPGSNDAIRRSFNSYRNEHPNTDMSLEDYKRKYGWMYGVGH